MCVYACCACACVLDVCVCMMCVCACVCMMCVMCVCVCDVCVSRVTWDRQAEAVRPVSRCLRRADCAVKQRDRQPGVPHSSWL